MEQEGRQRHRADVYAPCSNFTRSYRITVQHHLMAMLTCFEHGSINFVMRGMK